MADTKITALAALTAADPINDVIPIVDVSDTSMAASGTTKKISVNNILSSSPTASGALTVTGLVTAGSATISGDLTVDTSTLKVDAANNRVGIGIASPIDVFQISSQNPNVYITDNSVAGSDQANLYFGINTVPTYAGILVDFTNDILNVRHNQATRLSIGSTGIFTWSNVVTAGTAMTLNATGLAIANGNLIIGTSGKGIDFSATANSSGTMTSELLNDYEEGTWTGTLTGGTTNPTVVVTATGRYTKIGRVVTVQISYSNATTTGASGAIAITGLPFANNSAAQSNGSVSLYQIGTFTGSPFAIIDGAASSIDIQSNISGATYGSVTHNAGVARYMTTSITYTVA